MTSRDYLEMKLHANCKNGLKKISVTIMGWTMLLCYHAINQGIVYIGLWTSEILTSIFSSKCWQDLIEYADKQAQYSQPS